VRHSGFNKATNEKAHGEGEKKELTREEKENAKRRKGKDEIIEFSVMGVPAGLWISEKKGEPQEKKVKIRLVRCLCKVRGNGIVKTFFRGEEKGSIPRTRNCRNRE